VGSRGYGSLTSTLREFAASPLIAQYLALKEQYPEALLLARVGDFYEAYGDDADDLSRSLHIICTSKEAGKAGRIAMAGVPYHSVDSYLARLMRQRRVVAIAEQMEAPDGKTLVRREIVRVLTPGTVLEDQFLAAEQENYLCAVARVGGMTAIAYADVSTATAALTVVDDDDGLAAELGRIAPSEVVVDDDRAALHVSPFVGPDCRVAAFAEVEDSRAPSDGRERNASLRLAAIEAFSLDERPAAAAALDLLRRYLNRLHLDGDAIAEGVGARNAVAARTLVLDPSTRRHLDIVAASGDNAKASLLSVLSRTKTAMGSRLLSRRLCAPSVDIAEIRDRHEYVAALVQRVGLRLELQHKLSCIGDVERIVQKVRARRAGPRDASALRTSVVAMGGLCDVLRRQQDDRIRSFAKGTEAGGAPAELAIDLTATLVEEVPQTIADGGVIRPDHHTGLRETVALRSRSRELILALEERARTQSGIKSLKIKYTQAFGYYYEVSRTHADRIPAHFQRRQSLVNAERFSDPELKELEADLLGARSRQVALERDEFELLLTRIDARADALLEAARAIAELDVHCSLAQVAGERSYVKPVMAEERVYEVEGGRHPIVEAVGGVDFVPNGCRMGEQKRFLFITGPNMGGKSTYLRQTALLSIMAQAGSFVPASAATLGIVDRLFTRIGAGDDIASGRSTFYVEMAEMAVILRRCTPRSLLLIDEVGRGTGTTDGLAIAQSIGEYLLGLGDAMPMVLFATHFHELVGLAGVYPLIENLHVLVAEGSAGPVFSHRVLHGASSRSYGIAVAHMAGLPEEVVRRARELADALESRPAPPTAVPRVSRGADSGLAQLRLDIT
jgi:DNA mismatch repair protein MutS